MSLQLNQLTIVDKFTCDLFNGFVDELSVNYLTMVFDSVDEFTSICELSNDSVEVCTCELNSFSLISLTATQ